jgi:hypothetical protein
MAFSSTMIIRDVLGIFLPPFYACIFLVRLVPLYQGIKRIKYNLPVSNFVQWATPIPKNFGCPLFFDPDRYTPVVVSFSLTHMGCFSIVLAWKNRF